MAIKCTICGGQLTMQTDGSGAVCKDCGMIYPIETVRNMVAANKEEKAEAKSEEVPFKPQKTAVKSSSPAVSERITVSTANTNANATATETANATTNATANVNAQPAEHTEKEEVKAPVKEPEVRVNVYEKAQEKVDGTPKTDEKPKTEDKPKATVEPTEESISGRVIVGAGYKTTSSSGGESNNTANNGTAKKERDEKEYARKKFIYGAPGLAILLIGTIIFVVCKELLIIPGMLVGSVLTLVGGLLAIRGIRKVGE